MTNRSEPLSKLVERMRDATDISELLEGIASEGVTVRRVRYHAEGDER